MPLALPAVTVVWLSTGALFVHRGARPLTTAAPVAPGPTCSLAALPGLSGQFERVDRAIRAARGASDEFSRELASAAAAGPVGDFWRVAGAILGPAAARITDSFDLAALAGVGTPSRAALPCDTGVRSRDRVAWSMGLTGYSAQEIADVLGGHLTRADLDEAQSRLMAGHRRADVSAFLDARWRDRAPAMQVVTVPVPAFRPTLTLASVDRELTALALRLGVSPDLVRAVIAAESGGDPRAVSRAGAIGLMQLMPATAASLGVNPWQPLENLRGGIVYLASLLRAFGENARLALIAYNAGPQHANRVRAGSAVAYRETRKYLDAIATHYPLP